MSLIKTKQEIEVLREGGRILARILALVAAYVKPGISTFELDKLARQEIKRAGVEPAFLGYKIAPNHPPYSAVLCASVNEEIVHGIPRRDKVLREGDILGLDLGIKYQSLFTDAAVTVPVGKIDKGNQKLIDTAKQALERGIREAMPGNTTSDIGHAIQQAVEAAGFTVVRDLVGHGVGHAVHEPPNVPNYSLPRSRGDKLKPGMVIAIEPMITAGDWRVKFLDDGWTVVTADGSRSAHFEHTVAITKDSSEILTK